MAYNRNNLLNEVEEIQEIYAKHIQEGVTAKYIFNNYIKGVYHISERTFFTYLNINVARERREMAEGKKEQQNLPSLFKDQDFQQDEDTNNDGQ
jgi:hypothetical protein